MTPALEDNYKALSNNIEACGGEFHKIVEQLHHCLAHVFECYTDHSMLSNEVIRYRIIARLGGDGGQMGEDIQLNSYIKSAEHYLACGVSYAGHLANICQSNHEEILNAKNLDTLCGNISMLKTLHVTKTNNCFNS